MALFDMFKKRVLFFPGCLCETKLKDISDNYRKILQQFNLEVIEADTVCCGLPALNLGYKEDFNNLITRNRAIFNEHGIKKIITNSPECYYIFSKYYPGIEVEHITKTIFKNIDKLNIKNAGDITYFDPCYLSKYMNVYDEPREILRNLGFNVKEIAKKDHTLCCGGEIAFHDLLESTSNKIAKAVLRNVRTKRLITTSPHCYYHLKNNSNIDVLELSQVLI